MTIPVRVLEVSRLPLIRSSAALVLNTGINGVLGLAYWVVAARLLDPALLGSGAAGYSGMVFAASVGWIGLQQTLLRYLPVAGRDGARLIVGVYGAAAGIALGAAVGFLLYATTDPSLRYLVASPGEVAAFMAAVLIWVVFSLQDPALIGLRRAAWVPLENLAFGIAKLVLLLALTGVGSPWVVIASWAIGASWLIVVVSIAIRRTIRTRHETGGLPHNARLVRFSVGQHAIAVMAAAPESLVPIIVLALVGSEATAFYVAAWQVAFTVRLIVVNLGSAVTVERSVVGAPATRIARQIRVLVPATVVPAVAVVVLLAPFVMAVFGPGYANEATNLLRLLVVAVLPFTAVTLFVVGERVAERSVAAFGVVTLTTLTTLALDFALLPRLGLVAAGWSWLAAQTIGAGVASLVVLRRRRSAAGDPLLDGNTNSHASYRR